MTKKLHLAIPIAIIFCIIVFAAIFVNQPFVNQPPASTVVAGVAVGDTFTYSIRGFATKIDANATIPEGTSQLNMTEWFKVTITDVNNSKVYFSSIWRFLNGTEVQKTGKVNIETGIDNSPDFWAIYASGLNAGDLARPIREGLSINATDPRTYKDGERETNYVSLERLRYDTEDPSHTISEYL
ncbi:hypothetical protein KAI30_00885, partial [Candidatus Bathyarchaeota archaeon]|nr:hypothetical protein [Candidatus Bathyarchaeota archaeon]